MMIRLSSVIVVVSWMFASAAFAGCTMRKIADLPVTMVGNRPLVTAAVNGSHERFLADSGAFYSLISPAKAAELDLKTYAAPFRTIVGAGGSAEARAARVKTFSIAGGALTDIEFLVGGNGQGPDTAGMLGQNILGMADVEYDLANGLISLWTSRGCGNQVFAYWAAKDQTYGELDIDPMVDTQHHTVGKAYVNGVRIRAMFDTGASNSILTSAAARRAGIDLSDPRVVSDGSMRGGVGVRTAAEYIAPIGSFKVGGEEVRNTHLRVADADFLQDDMLIGADFFLSHRIYVSNIQHRMYFTYNGGPVFNISTETAAGSRDVSSAARMPERPMQDADALARRGAAESSRRDFADAITDLTGARSSAPGNPDFAYERAVAYLGNHQPLMALADLNDAIKLEPGNIVALVTRAQINLAEGDKARAVADLDASDHAAAKVADVRLALAELYTNADAPASAVTQYDLWLKSHPDDVGRTAALNGGCWSRAVLGQDLEKALADCDAALRLDSKASNVLDSRGLVHLRLGQFNKAIADYDAALAMNPKISWSLYGRGIAELRLGKTSASKADIAAATALEPRLPAIAAGYGVAP